MSTSENTLIFMAKTMVANPPVLPQDATIVSEMATIGLVPGQTFDMSKLSPEVQTALATVGKTAFPKIAAMQKNAGKVINGWVVPGAAGIYGTNYVARAYIAAYGWPANLPQDADYPNRKVDSAGSLLVGTNTYKLHFAKGETPPVNGFWSITMYDDQYFFYPNPLNKLTESMRDHPKFNADGSMDVYFSHTQPTGVPVSNWLPAPTANFILMMRLYWPKENPPSILPPAIRHGSRRKYKNSTRKPADETFSLKSIRERFPTGRGPRKAAPNPFVIPSAGADAQIAFGICRLMEFR